MREYLKDEDIVTPAFLELINMWWLLVIPKNVFIRITLEMLLVQIRLKINVPFYLEMNNWSLAWKLSKKLGLTKQTIEALVNTNAAIADLSYDLITDGFLCRPIQNTGDFLNEWRSFSGEFTAF